MANDVKWIRMMVGMFDGMSFKKIKRAKIGGESFRDKLTAVWFELMDFAGKCNHDGAFIGTNEIPFTDLSDIATMIDRDEEELKLCMAFFLKEGMVTIIDDVYSLANWSMYQNKDGLDKIREQNRQRVAAHRERKKLAASECNVTSNVTVTLGNGIEEEKERDKEYHSIILAEKSDEEDGLSTDLSTDVDNQRVALGGSLGKGVVMLSQEQTDDLLDKLSLDEFNHYVGVVADCILKGKRYKKKTHYQAILDMARQDRKVK